MKLRVFAIYDSKAEAYMQPFIMQTKGHALRAFTDLANDGKSQVSKHSNDFSLFEIAEYDEETASYTNHSVKINLGGAWELKDNKPEIRSLNGVSTINLQEERAQ